MDKVENELELNMLPVEQGDCIHLRFCTDDVWHNIIIDSGPAGTSGVFRHLLEEIRERKEKVDLLCFTHIDDDHIKGAERVFSNPSYDTSIISEIWLNLPEHIAAQKDVLGKYSPATVRNGLHLWTEINTHKIPCVTHIEAGKKIKIGDMEIEVLLPLKGRLNDYWAKWEIEAKKKELYASQSILKTDSNKYNGVSIVLLCSIGKVHILLTGDAFAEDLTEVALKYKDYDLTLVKLPHHGSSANISMEMLEALNCRSFLISTKQSSKRPSPDTIQLLGKYGVKNQTITTYGNYKWPRFQENYEHLKIIALQKYDNAEYIEGVKLYCEDKR